MKKTLLKLQKLCLNFIPTFTALLSLFINIIPYKISNASILMPDFFYMVIYYWTVYRPQLLPCAAILFLSLLKDIIEYNTLGISSLSALFFQLIILSQRKFLFNRAFIVVWLGFAFCLAIILVLQVILQNSAWTIFVSRWLISVFAYVSLHWVLSRIKLS